MTNIIQKSDPWETSFENLTGKAVQAGQQVKKNLGEQKKLEEKVIKEQVFGEKPKTEEEQKNIEEQKKLDEKKELVMATTRDNLRDINLAMKRARDERIKRQNPPSSFDKLRTTEGQGKKAEEVKEKQKKESLLQKMLKGKQGSREIAKGVSG